MALVERLHQEVAVVAEVDLVEAHHRHRRRVELVLELVRRRQLLLAELVVAVQQAQLDHDLDDVLHQLLRLLLVPRLQNTTHTIKLKNKYLG